MSDNPVSPNTANEPARGSGVRPTDEEVLCTFMEPREALIDQIRRWLASNNTDDYPITNWWHWGERPEPWVFPRYLTLNECHEVEARLTDEQQLDYRDAINRPVRTNPSVLLWWHLIHADAPTRIKALAAVLRPIVEAAVQSLESHQASTSGAQGSKT